MKNIFCKCGNLRRSGQRNYNTCHAANMRAKRQKHRNLKPDQKKKANARAYVKVYVRRGKVIKQPCRVCGAKKVEAHHENYDKPLEVVWLCRKHHLEYHKNQIAIK